MSIIQAYIDGLHIDKIATNFDVDPVYVYQIISDAQDRPYVPNNSKNAPPLKVSIIKRNRKVVDMYAPLVAGERRVDLGKPVTEIARELHLSPNTLYAIIAKERLSKRREVAIKRQMFTTSDTSSVAAEED